VHSSVVMPEDAYTAAFFRTVLCSSVDWSKAYQQASYKILENAAARPAGPSERVVFLYLRCKFLMSGVKYFSG